MDPIVDENNEVLEIGDWVEYSPQPAYLGIIRKRVDNYFLIDFNLNCKNCSYILTGAANWTANWLKKLSENEAMIRILEM